MTTYYLDSAGSNTSPYDTTAKAANTLATLLALAAAGDTILASHTHAETIAATSMTFPGEDNNPVKLISINFTGETYLAGAALTFSSHLTPSGSLYMRGAALSIGGVFYVGQGDQYQTYEDCSITLNATLSNNYNQFFVRFINCQFKFAFPGYGFEQRGRGTIQIMGGGLDPTGQATADLFDDSPADHMQLLIDGADLSSGSSSMNICKAGASASGMGDKCLVRLRNCKLPASWSGALFSTDPTTVGSRAELWNCDSGDTNYRVWLQDYQGQLRDETAIYRTAGASDGTTSLSWKVVTTANASRFLPHTTPDLMVWNETVGSSLTATVEFIVNSSGTALKDDEIWLEVQYQGTSGFPLASFITDQSAVLSTPADQATSTVDWTGATTPTKQKLSVSFTPQEKGFIVAKVHVGKPSATVYICPKLEIT